MNIEIIKKEEFNKIVRVKFSNILEGFDRYKYIELKSEKDNKLYIENDFIKAIEEFYDINNKNLIIDFYKERLDENSIDLIKSNIDEEDKIIFDELLSKTKNNENYYYINSKKIISLLVKLCTRELYFITFYFYKDNITLWGNYNLTFPLFYDDNAEINKYIDISKNNNIYE